MDIVNSVRGLFPDVSAAVEQYRQTKNDRDVRNLARRLANEEALYDQVIRKLSLLPSVASTNSRDALFRNVESKFGLKTADDLKSDLHKMEEYLRGLKADLANTSRGTEVLAKFRRPTNLSRAVLPRNPLQKRLDDLSRVNKRLTTYMLQSPTPLALVRDSQGTLDFELLLQQHQEKPSSALRVANARYLCAFQEKVAKSTSSLDKDVTLGYPDCMEDMTSLHHRSRHISIQSFRHIGDNEILVQDVCSTVGKPGSKQYPSQQDRDKEIFRITIEDATPPPAATSFENLFSHQNIKFDLRRRTELAFRLSSAVLLSCTASLMPHSSEWKDWVAFLDPDQDDLCNLYISPEPHLEKHIHGGDVSEMEALRSISREPALTLLGMRLTELAFGRTLAELRQETDNLLHRGNQEEENEDADDPKLHDLMTAKRLLALHRIGEEAGQNFEDVVNVCLNQQYRQQKGASIAELNFQDKSFLEHAAVAILLPLYDEAHRYSGCNCKTNDPNATGEKIVETKGPEITSVMDQKNENPIVPPYPAQMTTERNIDVSEVEADTNAIYMSSVPAPLRSMDDASGITSSNEPALHKQKHVAIGSGNVLHGSHQPDVETADAQHVTTSDPIPLEVEKKRSKTKEANVETRSPVIKSNPETADSSSRRLQRLEDSQLGVERPSEMLYPQTQDTDAATVLSYDTMAGTTDSAFPWLSDHSDEPPDIPDDHPLLSMKGVALRILLIAYRAWRERGNTATEPVGSASRADSSKKRTRMEHEKGQDDEDENDEEGSTQRTPGVFHKKRRVKEEGPTFSCPFLKKDALTYGRCCGYVLTRIRDVKQHLGRRHHMPIYCPRCIKTFNSEDERDAHVRDADCARAPHAKPEGITELQRKQLARKAPANQTSEQQWYGIFDVLFPGHEPRPQSPYIDSDLLQNVLAYHSFSMSSGPRILSDILIASGWRPPADESDAFQRHVLEGGFQAVFDEWTSLGGLPPSDSNTMDSSTRSLGGTNQQITSVPQGTTVGYHVEEQYSATTSSNFTAPSSSFETNSESYDGERELLANLHLDGWGLPFDTEEEVHRRLYEEMSLPNSNSNMNFH